MVLGKAGIQNPRARPWALVLTSHLAHTKSKEGVGAIFTPYTGINFAMTASLLGIVLFTSFAYRLSARGEIPWELADSQLRMQLPSISRRAPGDSRFSAEFMKILRLFWPASHLAHPVGKV